MDEGVPPEVEAAEYVLGLITGPEHDAAEARIASDPVFARHVRDWERRFAPLFEQVRDVTPPPSVWNGIAEVIAADGGMLPDEPANDGLPTATRAEVPAGRLRFWRAYGIGMTGIAAAVLAVLVGRAPPEPVVITREIRSEAPAPEPRPLLTARLSPEAGIPVAVITYDPAAERLLVTPIDIEAEDRTPELWYIPEDGTPRAIGLISATESSSFEPPEGFTADSTLAISIEPPGGSPTGLPTGPIVGTGQLSGT